MGTFLLLITQITKFFRKMMKVVTHVSINILMTAQLICYIFFVVANFSISLNRFSIFHKSTQGWEFFMIHGIWKAMVIYQFVDLRVAKIPVFSYSIVEIWSNNFWNSHHTCQVFYNLLHDTKLDMNGRYNYFRSFHKRVSFNVFTPGASYLTCQSYFIQIGIYLCYQIGT